MWIKKVELENFKPYQDAPAISFPSQGPDNISIIEGKNDTGKTSFLEAIKWCLYGDKELDKDTYELINKPRDPEKVMKVKLLLSDGEDRYQIQRKASPKRGHKQVSEEIDLARNESAIRTNKSKQEKKDYIETKILPRNISNFFFFKGEETENLAKNLGEDKILDNISLFLGFKSLEHAADDLENKVIDEWQDKLDVSRSKKEQIEDLLEEKKKKKKDKEQIEDQINDLKDSLNDLKSTKGELEKEKSELNEIKDLIEKESTLREEFGDLEDKTEKKKNELGKLMKGNYTYLLCPELNGIKQTLNDEYKKLAEETDSKLMKRAERELKRESLDGKCEICGRNLPESEIKELRKDLEKSNGEDYDDLLSKREKIKEFKEIASNILEKIENKNPANLKTTIIDLREEKDGLKNQLDELQDRMGNRDEKYKELQEEFSEIDKEISEIKSKIEVREEDIDEFQEKIDDIEEDISRKESKKAEDELLKTKIKWSKKIKDKFIKVKKDGAKEKRQEILYKMNNLFKKLTEDERGYKEIKFEEGGYSPILIGENDEEFVSSEVGDGQKQIVAFSFLLGLNRHSGKNVPLVIDAPFTVLDKVYRENLSSLLGDLENQVIILVKDTSRDSGNVHNILQKNQNKEFRINKDYQKNKSKISEVTI